MFFLFSDKALRLLIYGRLVGLCSDHTEDGVGMFGCFLFWRH